MDDDDVPSETGNQVWSFERNPVCDENGSGETDKQHLLFQNIQLFQLSQKATFGCLTGPQKGSIVNVMGNVRAVYGLRYHHKVARGTSLFTYLFENSHEDLSENSRTGTAVSNALVLPCRGWWYFDFPMKIFLERVALARP